MATKFIIDHEDAIQAIRKQYGIPSTVEIVVNWKETPVSGDDERCDDDWIDVPIDWDKESPPDAALMFNTVQVQHRSGNISIGDPMSFCIWWKQDDHYWDIIRYRGY